MNVNVWDSNRNFKFYIKKLKFTFQDYPCWGMKRRWIPMFYFLTFVMFEVKPLNNFSMWVCAWQFSEALEINKRVGSYDKGNTAVPCLKPSGTGRYNS